MNIEQSNDIIHRKFLGQFTGFKYTISIINNIHKATWKIQGSERTSKTLIDLRGGDV